MTSILSHEHDDAPETNEKNKQMIARGRLNKQNVKQRFQHDKYHDKIAEIGCKSQTKMDILQILDHRHG